MHSLLSAATRRDDMEYKAVARYMDQTYHGQIAGSDADAVKSVAGMLPGAADPRNVALIVHRVHRGNIGDISYVTTLLKYRIATEH